MDISVTYTELSNFVKAKFNQRIELTGEEDNTLCITYYMLMFSKKLRLQLAEVTPTTIILRFTIGFSLLDKVVSTALHAITNKYPDLRDGIQVDSSKGISIDLSKISKTAPLLDYFVLSDFRFEESKFDLILSLKGNYEDETSK